MRSYTKIFALLLTVITFTNCSTPKIASLQSADIYRIDSTITQDSSIVNYYRPFKEKMEQEMNRVIGHTTNSLTKSRSEAEFTAGNFFVDAMLAIGQRIDPTAQISLATKGGIRSEVDKGPITVGNIFELMPFENAISILELSGQDINTLLHFIAKTGGQPIGGMTMKIKDQQPFDVMIQGQPFDINKTYKLVTYDYLANGGDYVEGLTSPLKRVDTGIIVRNGLIDYIEQLTKEGKSINTTLDGRVKIIK
ncbi:5'-nucleotidase-like protein [Sphingobacterium alimentarium]|uniref:5'-nucleotidase-like protein n=1 Tax=Sphingobacterium alimentarium TaxID=797292 RepID=A0A4R3VZW8_9SPHI|nr:5'-nucleotidase [Sphingobacterium alimentarium]TCV13988.1 5'-nucleotidase-like protein [Sphingobacterium alimentarium]